MQILTPHISQISYPSNLSWFDPFNNIWWTNRAAPQGVMLSIFLLRFLACSQIFFSVLDFRTASTCFLRYSNDSLYFTILHLAIPFRSSKTPHAPFCSRIRLERVKKCIKKLTVGDRLTRFETDSRRTEAWLKWVASVYSLVLSDLLRVHRVSEILWHIINRSSKLSGGHGLWQRNGTHSETKLTDVKTAIKWTWYFACFCNGPWRYFVDLARGRGRGYLRTGMLMG